MGVSVISWQRSSHGGQIAILVLLAVWACSIDLDEPSAPRGWLAYIGVLSLRYFHGRRVDRIQLTWRNREIIISSNGSIGLSSPCWSGCGSAVFWWFDGGLVERHRSNHAAHVLQHHLGLIGRGGTGARMLRIIWSVFQRNNCYITDVWSVCFVPSRPPLASLFPESLILQHLIGPRRKLLIHAQPLARVFF